MEPIQATALYPPLWPSLWPEMWPPVWEPSWRPDALQLPSAEVKPLSADPTPLLAPSTPAVDASFESGQPLPRANLYTDQPELVAAHRQQTPAAASPSWVGQRIALAQWQEQQADELTQPTVVA